MLTLFILSVIVVILITIRVWALWVCALVVFDLMQMAIRGAFFLYRRWKYGPMRTIICITRKS